MANYCKKCGMYIPDGQKVCLGCGTPFGDDKDDKPESGTYTGTAAAAAAAAAATEPADASSEAETGDIRWTEDGAYRGRPVSGYRTTETAAEASFEGSYTDEIQRVVAEENRRRKAADSQKWAQEEYRKRRGETEEKRTSHAAETPNSDSPALKKIISCLSYLCGFPMFLLSYFLYKDDEEVKFHAREGGKLFISYVVLRIVLGLFGFGWLARVGGIAGTVFGIINTANGKKCRIPLIEKLGFMDELIEKIVK